MMNDAEHAPTPESPNEPAQSFSPAQVFGLVVFAAAAVLAAARWVDTAVPILVAVLVAALMPRRHEWTIRAPLAAIAGLLTLFVLKEWPAPVAEGQAAPYEGGSVLSFIIWLPIAGAVAVLFMPRQAHRILRWSTLVIMLATLAATIPLLRVPMGRGFHFNEDVAWLPFLGIRYHIAVDGISLWLVMLTVLITPLAAYASFGSIETRIKDWCFALLLLEGGMLGAFLSLDLFVFYIFWEIMLVPMYVMIGVWGSTNRVKSAIKFFLYTFFGSILMLGAILYLAYSYAGASGGRLSFDFFELQRLQMPRHVQIWLWVAFTLAFVIKVPMFPVHTWLPDAHTEAPTAGSVILAAVMLKLGTYGYLRFSLGLFPEASSEWGANLAGVAVLGGILYAALCAWKQDDVKRLIAYSSVAHLGYVMLGIFALTPAALEGAVLQMVNHGISTGALFLLVGVIYDRRHTRLAEEFGGLAKVMPVYAAVFVVITLASVGLPGTNGFVGEFMVITGTAASQRLGRFAAADAVGGAVGVILGALYMLGVVQKMFFGPITKKANQRLSDLNAREMIALAPLVALVFAIGFFPNMLLSQIQGAAARVEHEVVERQREPAQVYEGAIRLLPRSEDAPPAPGTATAAGPPAGTTGTGG